MVDLTAYSWLWYVNVDLGKVTEYVQDCLMTNLICVLALVYYLTTNQAHSLPAS